MIEIGHEDIYQNKMKCIQPFIIYSTLLFSFFCHYQSASRSQALDSHQDDLYFCQYLFYVVKMQFPEIVQPYLYFLQRTPRGKRILFILHILTLALQTPLRCPYRICCRLRISLLSSTRKLNCRQGHGPTFGLFQRTNYQ